MKDKLIQLKSNQLIVGSLYMLIGNNLVNILNYLYHLILGRILGPILYGELAAVISFMGLFLILPTSAGLVITKLVSSCKDNQQLVSTIRWFIKRKVITSLSFGLSLTLLSIILSQFVSINIFFVPLLSIVFIFYIPISIDRSILQGLLKFDRVVLSYLLEASTKFLLALGLVLLNFKVFGGIMGIVFSTIITALFLSKEINRSTDVNNKSEAVMKFKDIFMTSLPLLINSLALTSIYSVDVILAKKFLLPTEAGYYAALSTLARIIFFAAGPITLVMFPIISRKKSKGENYAPNFFVSVFLVLSISLLILLVYSFFPEQMINLLFGKEYLKASLYLRFFGLFMVFFTLANLITNFFLSIGYSKIVYLSIFAAIIQIVLIILVHSNLISIITISSSISIGLTICLIISLFLLKLKLIKT